MQVAFKVICYLSITALTLISCKNNDDTPPDCGCGSETRTTIPESANLVGRIVFKTQNYSTDTYYNNHYWITYIEKTCSNCIHRMIICNEDILGNDFVDLLNLPQGEYVEVNFSGFLKEICQKRFAPADVTFERIILTSIERQ